MLNVAQLRGVCSSQARCQARERKDQACQRDQELEDQGVFRFIAEL
jgi:hypothetical protein